MAVDRRVTHVQAVAPRHLADRWPLPLSPYNANMAGGRTCSGRTKVCIYGAGLYRGEAPLDDPSWEVWALNLVAPFDRQGRLRADVWFDLHQREAQSPDDLRWIAVCPVPIYVPPDLEDASPRAVHFPLAEIEELYGAYWSCTFAYQIALVLYRNRCRGADITDLGLYGVELAYGTHRERTVEWACTAYWLGRAEESGLVIHLPVRSTLGRHWGRYGFEYDREREAVRTYDDLMAESETARRAHGDGVDVGG